MPSTLDTKETPGLFALLKSRSGAGKSVLGFSFPTPYVFDFDGKMPGVAIKHFPSKAINWDTFDSIFAIEDILNNWLRNGCPYETLIVDTFTTLAQLSIRTLAEVKGEAGIVPFKQIENARLSGKRKDPSKSVSDGFLGFDYYKAEEHWCTYFIEQLKALHVRPGNPKHVLVNAHIVVQESAPNPLRNGEVTQQVSIVSKGRKVAAWLPSYFDNVFYIEAQQPGMGSDNKQQKRIVITEQGGENECKTTLNVPQIIDVTNRSFYDQLQEYTNF